MNFWRRMPLGEIAELVDYGVTASASHTPTGPKFLRITDIQNGSVNWDTVPWCECDGRAAAGSRLDAGDIVFARTGATTGKSFLIKTCPKDAVFASYLIRVRMKKGVDPRYVSTFFHSKDYWAQITKGSRGAAQPGVNATTLRALEIPIPPLPEQRRIAAILDQADALRTKRREALAQLDNLTQSIFIEMFGDLTKNTKKFKVQTLGDMCDVRDGTHDSPKFVSDGFPLVTTRNLCSGYIDFSSANFISEDDYIAINRRSKVDKGDILMPMIGTIGNPVLVDIEPNFAIKNMALIKLKDDSPDEHFILNYLRSDCFLKLVASKSKGGTQKFLSLGAIRGIEIPVPPFQLQIEFSSLIQKIKHQIVLNSDSLKALDNIFLSLQYRAFRGEL